MTSNVMGAAPFAKFGGKSAVGIQLNIPVVTEIRMA
jgi:hypothetical protein